MINLHAFEKVEALISDEAVFWFSDGSHAGKAQVRTAFEQTWRKIRDETYWLEKLSWIAGGELAASCTYEFHWRGLIDGSARSGKGRGPTVLRKEADGWKIVHEHLSPYPS